MKYFTVRPFRNKIIGLLIDQVHRNQKSYWASDLVTKGLTPNEICQAVQRAMTSCKQSGINVNLHFQLTHIESKECATYDNCKLSELGYLLTVINANPNNEYVARYQKQVLEHHLLAASSENI